MNYDERITFFKEQHARYDKMLKAAMRRKAADNTITEIKQNKLYAKDMIEKLTQLDVQGKEFK